MTQLPPLVYPDHASDRDAWILARRPERNAVDPYTPNAFFVEQECSPTREIVSVATVFLTNRECPWRCLMCDLWRNTTTAPVPPGAIPTQIDYALSHLGAARQIKLYNSGSFFDRLAIPVSDYAPIATQTKTFERVIVESHPALVGQDCLRFRDLLPGKLEVAMGLETVHPEILPRLNKRMTLDQLSSSATFLRQNAIDLRVFILVKPPFINADEEALHWAKRSLDFAFDCHASVAALIPTRAGNGALDVLSSQDQFSPPSLATLEAAAAYGIGINRGRVFVDLWDCQRLSTCQACYSLRIARLQDMNLKQYVPQPIHCRTCGGSSA